MKKHTVWANLMAISLYYPASNDVFRYKNKLQEEGLKPGQLIVKNHLRLKTQFKDDNPHGSYKAYLHPRGQNLELTELLKEEGTFNEQGLLAEQQFRYFPRTAGLAVILPILGRLEEVFEPNELGFSKAIDQAAEEIAKTQPIVILITFLLMFTPLMIKAMKSFQFGRAIYSHLQSEIWMVFYSPDRFEPKYEYFVRQARSHQISSSIGPKW